MERLVTSGARLGIVGGGQLGKMLALAASRWDIRCHILDPDPQAPSAGLGERFVVGDFASSDDVVAFGQRLDLVTFEIERANVEALEALERGGVRVRPQPRVLATLQDKGLQKAFYEQHGLPTAPFALYESAAELRAAVAEGREQTPLVQKLRVGGYDGRGVYVVEDAGDLDDLLEGRCLAERRVDVQTELSVMVARNARGQTVCYPAVEMVFDPRANLVDWLVCPARVDPEVTKQAEALALDTARALRIEGVLAVELFVDGAGEVWINEASPRPHNSGHHTIESCFTSQYEQHLRAIYGMPLGSTDLKLPSVMVNILGEPGHEGAPRYVGLTECMALDGVKIHIYGKAQTRPKRKMGHVTVLGHDLDAALRTAQIVRDTLKVKAWPKGQEPPSSSRWARTATSP